MDFLAARPALFFLARDKMMVKIFFELEVGGKSVEELAAKYKIKPSELNKLFDDLVQQKVLDSTFAGQKKVFFLSFDGKRAVDLLKKARLEAGS